MKVRPYLFLFILLVGLGFAGIAMAGEVWVANMKGANVQVIDTASNQIVNTIPTGAGAHNVTFSPDGKLAFIANLGTNSITIIDAVSKEKSMHRISNAMALGVVLLAAFVWSQTRVANPFFPVALFRRPLFLAALCAGFVFNAGGAVAFLQLSELKTQ